MSFIIKGEEAVSTCYFSFYMKLKRRDLGLLYKNAKKKKIYSLSEQINNIIMVFSSMDADKLSCLYNSGDADINKVKGEVLWISINLTTKSLIILEQYQSALKITLEDTLRRMVSVCLTVNIFTENLHYQHNVSENNIQA